MSGLEIRNLTQREALMVAPLYAACFGEGYSPKEGWGEKASCWKESCLVDGRGMIIPYVEIGTPCPTCSTPMTEAYPLEWTTNYINEELSYSGTIGLLGLVNGIVAAAAWGYEGDIATIAAKKYPNNEFMVNQVVGAYERAWPGQSQTLHISEVFVGPDYRRKDFAQELVNKMVRGARYPATSRTLGTSPMTSVLKYAGLTQILFAGSDPGNSQRVFYASSNI